MRSPTEKINILTTKTEFYQFMRDVKPMFMHDFHPEKQKDMAEV